MTTHVMAMTYAPKEQPVQAGTCTQTIRRGEKVNVGDEILFHGWSDRPYRSPWSWRKKVTVTWVMTTFMSADEGVQFDHIMFPWGSSIASKLAAEDGIVPPTGTALRDVLFPTNNKYREGMHQIIRWES